MKNTESTIIEISKLGLMGQGVGNDDAGNIYFVPGAVPGDQCRIEFVSTSKRYRDAQLVEILRASADRVTPVCPHFGECGGCDWLHLSYPAQLRAKEATLTHILEKTAVQPARRLPIRAADPELGYRNRIQVRRENGRLGFYRRRSHDIIDIEHCAVSDPRLNAALAELRKTPEQSGRTKIELAVGPDGQVIEVSNRGHAATGFGQIHSGQNRVLQELVRDWVRECGAKSVLELFAGDGNLTVAYAPEVSEVVAVELSRASIDKGKARIQAGELPKQVRFELRNVHSALWETLPPEFAQRCDTLIVDPPRTGVGADLGRLCRPPIQNFIYISCSPSSFSQDVQRIKARYSLDSVLALDMFPQTRHIEIASLWKLR